MTVSGLTMTRADRQSGLDAREPDPEDPISPSKAGTPGRGREHTELVSQREILGGERRAGAETSDGEQSKEEQHRRQRYPRSPSSHTKRKSMYNHVYGVFGRDTTRARKWTCAAKLTVPRHLLDGATYYYLVR